MDLHGGIILAFLEVNLLSMKKVSWVLKNKNDYSTQISNMKHYTHLSMKLYT